MLRFHHYAKLSEKTGLIRTSFIQSSRALLWPCYFEPLTAWYIMVGGPGWWGHPLHRKEVALGVEVGKGLVSQYSLLECVSNDNWTFTNGPLEDTWDVSHNKIWTYQYRAQGSWYILKLLSWIISDHGPQGPYAIYSLILAGILSSSLILANFDLLN